MQKKLPTFLVVEDNELDVEKLKRCFKKLDLTFPLRWAVDGYAALEILRGENGQEKLNGAYVMLLDLNMPRMSGLELLAEIRSDATLARAPVFVMTTSDHHADVDAAHGYFVAGYIVKPLEMEHMLDAVDMLRKYCEHCVLPGAATA